MLTELHIKNFALIEDESVSFGEGLNVISGETGAGKSILLQAVQLLLGGKVKPQMVRTGAEEAEVEGVFNLEKISPQIFEELPDVARTSELSISRSLSSTGRGRVYVNGRLASLAVLEDIAEKLVNICGQNQHVRLLEPRYHLDLLDGFAENGALIARYQEAYLSWKESEETLQSLKQKSSQDASRQRDLEEIVQVIGAAGLRPGLRQELEAKVKKMSGAERLIQTGQSLLEGLSSDEGILEKVQALGFGVQEILKLDPSFSQAAQLFSSARTELKEFETEVSDYISRIEVDEKALEELRDRLAEVARLERKYRTDEAGLAKLLSEARAELEAMGDAPGIEKLEEDTAKKFSEMQRLAGELEGKRKAAGKNLSTLVAEGLSALNMAGCQLGVRLEKTDCSLSGSDRLELLISTNKGEPLRPLREIASGGELSRIMLILKQVLRDRTGVNVLVFDEVDSGVSGKVAHAVGRKLKELASYSQVICITHLPQVAAMAETHLLVQKDVKDRAVTSIKTLSGKGREEEVARMLSGERITNSSRESARELLASNK